MVVNNFAMILVLSSSMGALPTFISFVEGGLGEGIHVGGFLD